MSGWCICFASTREPWLWVLPGAFEEPFVSGPRAGSPGLGVVGVSINANPREVIGFGTLVEEGEVVVIVRLTRDR